MDPGEYDHQVIEASARALWEAHDVYRYDRAGTGPVFSVDTPPPYVSAAHLHVGHAMSYSQPDFIVRFRRMRGERVFYPIGFDDNGLPTERYVEQAYGVRAADMPRAEFVALCLAETQRTAARYEDLWRRLGLSVDWSLRYSTIDERCQRTAQASFLALHAAGHLRRAQDPILWCPLDATSLAQADVEDLERTSRLHTIDFGGGLRIATTSSAARPATPAASPTSPSPLPRSPIRRQPGDFRHAGVVKSLRWAAYLRHNGVVKNVRSASPAKGDGPTKGQVARLILELGPSTAATLGGRLGLTPAAIRRHLDSLLAEGLIETRTDRTYGNRGRGRPAKVFIITDAGRSAFEHAYDDLAAGALRFLAETAGPDAVAQFARRQTADLERRYAPAVGHGELAARVQALAEALSADGYAASAGPAPAIAGAAGEQLCQHHCPVAHVAAEFPELCEAETEAFGRLLGTPVQRLATIAHGDGICTTHVTDVTHVTHVTGSGKAGPAKSVVQHGKSTQISALLIAPQGPEGS